MFLLVVAGREGGAFPSATKDQNAGVNGHSSGKDASLAQSVNNDNRQW